MYPSSIKTDQDFPGEKPYKIFEDLPKSFKDPILYSQL